MRQLLLRALRMNEKTKKRIAREVAARRDLHLHAHAVARICPPQHVRHVLEELYPDLVGAVAHREYQAILALAITPLA